MERDVVSHPLAAKPTMLIVRDGDGSALFKYQSEPECLSNIGSRFQSGLSIEDCTFLAVQWNIRKPN
jgi:hypothetical protein